MNFSIVSRHEERRSELEQFIHHLFKVQYGADIDHYLPWLMSIDTIEGGLQGALGINPAETTTLFLEQYLNHPIEAVIAEATQQNIFRANIVEVGNLAANSAGGARLLIVALTAFLRGAEYEWVTFTALPALINSFHRLGIPLYTLADANPDQLEDRGKSWGSYYEGAPQVVAGNVRQGFKALQQASAAERLHAALVWSEAYSSGCQLRVTQPDPCSMAL